MAKVAVATPSSSLASRAITDDIINTDHIFGGDALHVYHRNVRLMNQLFNGILYLLPFDICLSDVHSLVIGNRTPSQSSVPASAINTTGSNRNASAAPTARGGNGSSGTDDVLAVILTSEQEAELSRLVAVQLHDGDIIAKHHRLLRHALHSHASATHHVSLHPRSCAYIYGAYAWTTRPRPRVINNRSYAR